MNIAHHIELGRRLFPDKPALIFEGKTFTYKELDETANRMAFALSKIGIEKYDRVALVLPNIPAFVFCYLGIQKIGAIAATLNPGLKADDVAFILEDCQAKAVITTESLKQNIRQSEHMKHILIASDNSEFSDTFISRSPTSSHSLESKTESLGSAVEMNRDDPAVIVYTSGTTGFPKGVTLSHGNVISNMHAKTHYCGIRPDDRVLLFLPLFHSFGQNAIMNACLNACAAIIMHRHFDQELIIQSLRYDGATMFFAVPPVYISLFDKIEPADMRSVRYYFSAASTLPAEIAQKWVKKFSIEIHQGYGLTETSPFACYNHFLKFKPGSIGSPVENVEMKIVDIDTGKNLMPGQIGEIIIRGPNVMLGYWNRPEETAQTIRNGWLHTGDLGKMDEEGYFFIVDRLKDVINIGGHKIYPAEVENILYRHPAVADAAVYDIPDSLMGERVQASIVLKTGNTSTEEEIITFCRRHLSGHNIPIDIVFINEIPRGASGKILKQILKSNQQDIRKMIEQWMIKEMDISPESIIPGKSFFEYGITSMDAVALAEYLGRRLGPSVEPTVAWSFSTIEALAEHLMKGVMNAECGMRNAECGMMKGMMNAECGIMKKNFHNSSFITHHSSFIIELWPSVAEFFVYDDFLYYALTHDELRNQRYKAAIDKIVKDKIVLDVGTGKDAILARLCVDAGASKVYAVEINEQSYRMAAEQIQSLNLSDRIIPIFGDAARVNLPEPADICVSEIVGSIGGSEGAAVIINGVRRLLKPGSIMIPQLSITKIAACRCPDDILNRPVFPKIARRYVEKIFEQVGRAFDLRLCIKNFPKSHLISDTGCFEYLDFNRNLETEYQRNIQLTINKNSRLDGFLVWLNLQIIEGQTIDIFEESYSWLPVYFPVFHAGILVAEGDIIDGICIGRLSDNKLNPDYEIKGMVIRKNGEQIEFQYASQHHGQFFGHNPFYERIFKESGIALKYKNPRSLEEIARLLKDEIESMRKDRIRKKESLL